MEVGIAGTDPVDTVLAHEDGRVRIMKEIAGKVRQLGNHLACDVGMSSVGTSTPIPGEASNAATNFHAWETIDVECCLHTARCTANMEIWH